MDEYMYDGRAYTVDDIRKLAPTDRDWSDEDVQFVFNSFVEVMDDFCIGCSIHNWTVDEVDNKILDIIRDEWCCFMDNLDDDNLCDYLFLPEEY
jgi:hypothetical protein